MSDDAQRWKAKYLQSLEQQEKLEKRWDFRLDLLRRGLVRSSLAAEGSDKAVDQCMRELREIVRGDQMDAGLSALIPRLERTVLDSEHRRQRGIEQSVAALGSLANRLLELDLPRELRKDLKQFAKRINESARHPREMPALLAELSMLQGQALLASQTDPALDRPGLLQRLFGGRDDAPACEQAPENARKEPVPPAASEPVAGGVIQPYRGEAPVAPGVTVAPRPAAALTAGLDSLPLPATLLTGEGDSAYALPSLPEPGYSAVAQHVADSLRSLLDELELPEYHQPQAEALRQRLQGGLNWYELVPVLDDLGVLVLAVTDNGQREFAGYLKQLNQRLAQFLDNLSVAQDGHAESERSARALDDQLREQVSGLQTSVQGAADLEHLKQSLEQRLGGLLDTLDHHQQQRAAHEQALGERLQALMAHVSSMEAEAQGFRDNLEAQRQRALRDPLTGLPNRAAWNERLDLEVARQQRYGGDLLLAVIDIDHFKRINDSFGHLAGDKVLKLIAAELARRLRKTDFIARFGGEEFVLLLPGTPLEGGQQLLENLRTAVEACPFHFKGERVAITFSAGLTAQIAGERSDETFQRADRALYRAKQCGRNRVEIHEPDSIAPAPDASGALLAE
ncbi:GGDEF domain-containing protein [Metapseudomonas boanensis]|uniref:diguanylate cyclase n=1 Tax=Metapseudomonas boanensis TaxID=2822138 RepID=A0ABS5XI98_9GAMM|nr:GGDEF domain-containing protein [Pseudomonas boanensis]MBT8767414.1 diguanylate cyclase [Pseudomonas boanensis]